MIRVLSCLESFTSFPFGSIVSIAFFALDTRSKKADKNLTQKTSTQFYFCIVRIVDGIEAEFIRNTNCRNEWEMLDQSDMNSK